jgi:hypothetical protein
MHCMPHADLYRHAGDLCPWCWFFWWGPRPFCGHLESCTVCPFPPGDRRKVPRPGVPYRSIEAVEFRSHRRRVRRYELWAREGRFGAPPPRDLDRVGGLCPRCDVLPSGRVCAFVDGVWVPVESVKVPR